MCDISIHPEAEAERELPSAREAVAVEKRAALQELAETYTPLDAESDGYVSTR